MITVQEYENGKDLPDDIYRPVFEWFLGQKILVKFVGVKSKVTLHPDFNDVLEQEEKEK